MQTCSEELEAKVTALELIEKHLLQCCKDHKSRIKELEAELYEWSSAERLAKMEVGRELNKLQSRIEELEARHDTQAHHYGTKIHQLQSRIEAGLKLANNPEWQGYTEYVRADKLREALTGKLNQQED